MSNEPVKQTYDPNLKEKLEKDISKLSKKLAKNYDNNFTPENIETIQSIIIQSMIEEISKACFGQNYGSDIGKDLILQISSNSQLFNKSGLPGVIWETMEKLVTNKLEGEFQAIFDFIHVSLLGRGLKKETCCC